jgi:large subunit ribosomal protein L15e
MRAVYELQVAPACWLRFPKNTFSMGAYKYIQELWKKKQSDLLRFVLRVRTWELRQLSAVHRANRPTRPDKARRLGYKAKQGFVVYRSRIRRGGRKRKAYKGIVYGKPKNQGVNQVKTTQSLQVFAEQRAGKKCSNLRVLNSYWIGQDSTYKYYEVILVDPSHNAIRNDPRVNWICSTKHNHRENRGLTSAGKKSRGMAKGLGHNKIAPSRRGNWKRRQTLSLRRYR